MELIIDHTAEVEGRIAKAQEALPWIINLHPSLIRNHDHEGPTDLARERRYSAKLFEFPEGTSRKMMLYRIRRSKGIPANPAHMLAFAEQAAKEAFKGFYEYGLWSQYVVGLGGEIETVLGSQFGGLNHGTTFFFQHVPQNRIMHNGGKACRFLAIKPLT